MKVQSILKKEGINPIKIVEKSKGFDHKIYLIYSNQGNFVLRMPIKEKNKIMAQAWAFKRWGEIGVPVPKIISIKKDYLLEELIEGEDMDDENPSEKVCQKILFNLGKYLKKMHTIRTKGFGYMKSEGVGTKSSWNDFIYPDFMETLKDNFKNKTINKTIKEVAEKYVNQNIAILNIRGPRLLHSDISNDNIIIKDDKISGIIDASDSMSGDPYYDLGVVRANFGDKLFEHFARGYGKIDKKRLDFYTLYYYNWKMYVKANIRKNPRKLRIFLKEFKRILSEQE